MNLKLLIQAIFPFKVSTDSGEKLVCDKVCKSVELKIQGERVKMDLFLIPMVGSNVVIGIQWLKSLGDIISNYEALTMRFTLGGKDIT